MKKTALYIVSACLLAVLSSFILIEKIAEDDWGFFGHRLVNRMAVFTLPPELIAIYKDHIEYVTEHAVDPDKRRYANSFEAVRHFIDIDHWGTPPFDNLPREWGEALAKFTIIKAIAGEDTLEIFNFPTDEVFNVDSVTFKLPSGKYLKLAKWDYVRAFRKHFVRQYYSGEWKVELADFLKGIDVELPVENYTLLGEDRLSPEGIVPYTMSDYQNRLTRAFESGDISRVLFYSAEIGHYIGDAHVPLHTTTNYNGQLTGQTGLHAFWESRIPELFADTEYDFFVGKAEYIEDKQTYFWDIVLESFSYVDSVLLIEQRLRKSWDESGIYCYDERLGRIIRTECAEYAEAYDRAMGGMVEARMRGAIRSIGSAWYTAWVDAGQPQLSEISDSLYNYVDEEFLKSDSKKFQIRGHE